MVPIRGRDRGGRREPGTGRGVTACSGALREESGTRVTNYLYTDQEYDPESGLCYFGARYYDPVLRRFLTADAIVPRPYDPQSLNRYAYVRNSPASRIDPDGHGDWFWYVCIGGDCSSPGGGLPPYYDPWSQPQGPYSGPYGGVPGGGGGGVVGAAIPPPPPTPQPNRPPPVIVYGDPSIPKLDFTNPYLGLLGDGSGSAGAANAAGAQRQWPFPLTDPLISHGHGFLNSFDYISVGVGFFDWVGGGLHVTLDRNGYITWGWAGGVGLGGKGFGLSLGTYEGDPGTPVHGTRPSAEQLRMLNTGWSTNLSAAVGPGIGVNWPWHSQYTATELQLQVPGFGLSAGKSYEITTVGMLSW